MDPVSESNLITINSLRSWLGRGNWEFPGLRTTIFDYIDPDSEHQILSFRSGDPKLALTTWQP
ncbi:hypothetical protein N7495_001620 [Penicillium taxi]|uniref:uncharacterized protein n=1 Tax=Penicillium taxi TaxID=168475 RepID=UPI002545A794|nr:uncharacterized protein N7495_001620 [Penicillium taxi]KAJ5908938.1 hypothetical protein N7495_001620 [Penicillium taxi]